METNRLEKLEQLLREAQDELNRLKGAKSILPTQEACQKLIDKFGDKLLNI